MRSNGDEAGHDRAGPHGRRHGPAPDARRPRMRGLRHAPGGRPESRSPGRLRGVLARRSCGPAGPPADRLADGACRRGRSGPGEAHADPRNRRHRGRRRKLLLPRRYPAQRRAEAARDPSRGRGDERRRRGLRARLLPDDRRRKRGGAASRSDLCRARPGADAAPPTPGRGKRASTAEQGYLHCGPQGAGHFVKMVHNGIEYGLMAAYAEGLNILRHADAGMRSREADAETTPLRNPEYYRYQLDLPEIVELWRRGSVIGSWLLDLTARALLEDPALEGYAGRVSDSGEGRWTLAAAVDEGGP